MAFILGVLMHFYISISYFVTFFMQFYFTFEQDTMEEHCSWMVNLVSMKIGKLKVFGYVTGNNGLIWIREAHFTKFVFWYFSSRWLKCERFLHAGNFKEFQFHPAFQCREQIPHGTGGKQRIWNKYVYHLQHETTVMFYLEFRFLP